METVSSKIPSDVKEKVEAIAEDRDITRSKAIRDLIEDGLEDDQPERTFKDTAFEVLFYFFAGSFIASALLSLPTEEILIVLLSGGSLASLYIYHLYGRWYFQIQIIPKDELDDSTPERSEKM